jgi:hypothetical protein
MSTEVDALLNERAGYVVRGMKDRVAQVDAEIKRLGGVVVDDAPETTEASMPSVERAVAPKAKRK